LLHSTNQSIANAQAMVKKERFDKPCTKRSLHRRRRPSCWHCQSVLPLTRPIPAFCHQSGTQRSTTMQCFYSIDRLRPFRIQQIQPIKMSRTETLYISSQRLKARFMLTVAYTRRLLNYSWITLHGVFIAGLAYVYCVGRALTDPTGTLLVPDYLEIINDTRACSNMLVAISERWNAIRRSCELFNSLSNAVIRDAVNATLRVSNESTSGQYDRAARQAQSTRGTNFQHSDRITSESREHGNGLDRIPLMDHIFVADEFR
jgi:hypothetical protein